MTARIAPLGARLIGLCGRSGSGKDVVASHLVERHGFVRVAVADHLKRVTGLAFHVTEEQLWGAGRNDIDPRWGKTPREIYQQLGDALRDIHPDALIGGWRREVKALLGRGRSVVASDVRTPGEVAVLRELGGSLWRVQRSDVALAGGAAEHATERAFERFEIDATIENDSSREALRKRASSLAGAG